MFRRPLLLAGLLGLGLAGSLTLVAGADTHPASTTGSSAASFPVTRVVTSRRVLHPLVIGHRGNPSQAPEETLPSFQAAIDAHADVLEFDVQWTKDNAMVAMHDDTLDRTTDCTGSVQSKTLAAVRACDAGSWRGARWAGTRVPTMQEVVALAKQHAIRIAPEIKQDTVTAAQVAAFARVITAAGMKSRTVVQSFSPTSLQQFRALGTGVAVGLITSRATRTVASVRATGAMYYIVDYPSITPAQVTAFQAAGISVWLYTVTNASNNALARSSYPNGIITNDVGLTRSQLP
jgi:glycerophosphoryl diester phosphodiesterase